MHLSSRRYLEIAFTLENGIQRSLSLSGRIEDSDPEFPSLAESILHNKPVRVEIYSPLAVDHPDQIAEATGIQQAMGVARINANGEPERFEILGESVTGDAVRIRLGLNPAAFTEVQQLTSDAETHGRKLFLIADLAGHSLPPTKTDHVYSIFGLRPEDLDFATSKDYAIREFKISVTGSAPTIAN